MKKPIDITLLPQEVEEYKKEEFKSKAYAMTLFAFGITIIFAFVMTPLVVEFISLISK